LVTELSWVSQVPLLSQSSKPAVQVVATHVPVEHDSLEFGMSHLAVQLPQLTSVVSDVSQPFCAFMSQLSQPLSQPYVQPVEVLQPLLP
jgi:hypothetical protein